MGTARAIGITHPLGQPEGATSAQAKRCHRKFLRIFPKGFKDRTYLQWERNYKWEAHQRWEEKLSQPQFEALLAAHEYRSIVQHAVSIESRTNLLFSFEKMALRDAVKSDHGARVFALALYTWLHGGPHLDVRFERLVEAVDSLPRIQTRVLTWPVLTVFGFLAIPKEHLFLKPLVTRKAAAAYGAPFQYHSRPQWSTYQDLLDFGDLLKTDLADLRPRDMIDIQSFIWVMGSPEYE